MGRVFENSGECRRDARRAHLNNNPSVLEWLYSANPSYDFEGLFRYWRGC